MDRRGRGSSGDAETYDIQREFEDIAVVVDAVAERSGTPVNLYGHSYGALCAIGASTLTTNINKLVLYEPVVSGEEAASPDLPDKMDQLLAEGKREAIVEILFRDVLGMDEDELTAFRSAPSWQGRIDAAHTVAREFRAEMGGLFDRLDVESISVPTLLLKGELSPNWLRADTDRVAARLPDVRVVVLEGQEHVADVMAPELFAGYVLTFLSDA
jgi:pimeloyl-ACP methyl ester carboxylesterase